MASPKNKTPSYVELEPRSVLFRHALFFRVFFFMLLLALLPLAVSLFLEMRMYQTVLPQYLDAKTLALLIESVRTQFYVITAFAFLIVVCLAFFLARSIAHPISLLTQAIRRIAAGDMTFRVSINRKDEIGSLNRFFNKVLDTFLETQERNLTISRVKSQFVSVAAHQLRTPLSAMKWTLRLILDGDMGELTPKQREFLTQGYQTNERMIRLVNDFLDISRIEEGRFGFQFSRVRIADIAQKAVTDASLQSQAAQVSVELASQVKADLTCIADEERLLTAMANLLDNAIRYNHPGGVVTVTVTEENGVIEVRIADTGIGIPKDEQAKIFARFYRASNALRHQTEGSGLGLYIVQNIIRRHGGDISFESEEGKGTTVLFTIPVQGDSVKQERMENKKFIAAV